MSRALCVTRDCVLILLVSLLSSYLAAQVNLPAASPAIDQVWRSIGPNGGWIQTLAIDPVNPSTLYADANGGGIFKSTDGGNTWIPKNNGPLNFLPALISCLILDPKVSGTLYVGSSGLGMFKSTDGGESWNAVNNGLSDTTVVALAIDPVASTTVYAGTESGVLFKSTNGGGSWSSLGLISAGIVALAIDPINTATIYVGAVGVFKSTDGGATWNPSSVGLPTSVAANSLAIDPLNPSIIYAGLSFPGIFKSIDGGATWTSASVGLTSSGIFALAIDPIDPMTLYMANNDGVFKTTNGGSSWVPLSTSLGNTFIIQALAVDPRTAGVVYEGAFGQGVFKSTDGGVNWSAINVGFTSTAVFAVAIDPVTPTTLYASYLAGGASGIVKSTDGGTNWVTINNGLSAISGLSPGMLIIVVDPKTPSTLYAGGGFGFQAGIFKSVNSGASWISASIGIPTEFAIRTMIVNPSNPTTLYAAGASGISKSTDGAGRWLTSNIGLTQINTNVLIIDPQNSSTLYAGTNSGGVFKSTDGASSWAATGLVNIRITAMAIDPAIPGVLYAASFGSFFKTADGGSSWQSIATGIPLSFISSLAVDPITSAVYAASEGFGVFRSIDGGNTWTPINDGLVNPLATALAINPIDSQIVYVGTLNGGSFVLTAKSQALGTISVSTNIAAATFTITGPATYTGQGTSFTQTNAPTGAYTIQYRPVAGYSTPPNETRTLTSGATLPFSATYSLIPKPKLTVLSGTLAFSAIDGFLAHIPAQSVSINTDTGISVDVSISVSTGSGQWLSIGGSSGTTPTVLAVGVSILPVGQYSGIIRITSSSVSNSPIDVPVTFTVIPLAPYTVLPTIYPTGVIPEGESTIAGTRSELAAAITDVSTGRFSTQLANSSDSGNFWTHGLVSSGTSDNLDWSNVADPVVAMGRNGAIYIAEIHLRGSANGLYVAAGSSADPPMRRDQIHRVTANTSSFASTCEDKPWITVDNSGSSFDSTIYAVWDHISIPSHTGCSNESNLVRKVLAALFWGSPNGSRIMISVSHDGGISWSQPKIIGGGTGTSVFGPQVAVAPSGSAYVLYQVGAGGAKVAYAMTSSLDGGNIFTSSFIATPSITPPRFSFIDHRMSSPAMAISPLTGEIAIAFADQAADGTTRIKVMTSTDGGQSFSGPVTVNDTQTGNRFRPALTYDDFGILHIAWIDTRNAIDDQSFDIYASYAADGGTQFAPNTRLSLTTIKGSAGDFVGDYNGVTAIKGTAWFSWAAGSVDRTKNTGNGQLAVGQAMVPGISQ